jgi:hypothetical protein
LVKIFAPIKHGAPRLVLFIRVLLELGLIQTQMAQKPMLREAVYGRALRASQNVKGAESG